MTLIESTQSIEVLIAEDNPDDVFLTQEAFKDAKLSINLSVVEDGQEALDFLRRRGPYADAPCPDLILLDLNMPKKDGREVLKEIKTNDKLRLIPVIVLTTSSAVEDINEAYQLYANCYITKPTDFNEFTEVVELIEDFWFSSVRLPRA